MAVSARKTGLSVAVFTLDGTSLICELEDATITVEVSDEDARGVCDEWEYAWSISRRWQIEANLFVADYARVINEAVGNNQVVVVFNTGGNTYNGTGIVTNATHNISKGSLQKQGITIKGQGALAVTPP